MNDPHLPDPPAIQRAREYCAHWSATAPRTYLRSVASEVVAPLLAEVDALRVAPEGSLVAARYQASRQIDSARLALGELEGLVDRLGQVIADLSRAIRLAEGAIRAGEE